LPRLFIPDVGVTVSAQVSVAKDSIGFSAAHFLTLRGHVCERLHGHNYRLGATVEGTVDPHTGFVVDFAVLKHTLRRLVEPLDHRILIPIKNPALGIREEGNSLIVDYEWPAWLTVPRAHACLLPVEHTTAEVLAGYFASLAFSTLTSEPAPGIHSVVIDLEESAGQWATARCSAPEPS
jgi:6-pyruvoyltetrahydropterin/6-carboxytetrahydropterin synthase